MIELKMNDMKTRALRDDKCPCL